MMSTAMRMQLAAEPEKWKLLSRFVCNAWGPHRLAIFISRNRAIAVL